MNALTSAKPSIDSKQTLLGEFSFKFQWYNASNYSDEVHAELVGLADERMTEMVQNGFVEGELYAYIEIDGVEVEFKGYWSFTHTRSL